MEKNINQFNSESVNGISPGTADIYISFGNLNSWF